MQPIQPRDERETPPLSVSRVRKVLAARQVEYLRAESGDTGIQWEDRVYWVRVAGEVARVSATWPGTLPFARLDALRGFIRDWHAENYWPKLVYGINDDGSLTLSAEVSADWESGVADRQLDDMLSMSVAKIREAFRGVENL